MSAVPHIPPHGMHEIVACFGDIDDPDFERQHIVTFDLPFRMYFEDKPVLHARAHQLAVPYFRNALQDVLNANLAQWAKTFGGIYTRRPMHGYAWVPSLHSWGIAIDLNPDEYPFGSTHRFPQEFVDIWKNHGFTYGGDFKRRKDPMHFQLASGY